jgi:hypothetical protein
LGKKESAKQKYERKPAEEEEKPRSLEGLLLIRQEGLIGSFASCYIPTLLSVFLVEVS